MARSVDVCAGLAEETDSSELEASFSRFGDLEACFVPPPAARRSEPAYLRFASVEAAAAALEACARGDLRLRGGLAACRLRGGRGPSAGAAAASGGQPSPPESTEVVEEFIRSMSLGEDCAQLLRGVSGEVQEAIVTRTWGSEVRGLDKSIIAFLKTLRPEQLSSCAQQSLLSPPPPPPPRKRAEAERVGAPASAGGGGVKRLLGKMRDFQTSWTQNKKFRFISSRELPASHWGRDVFMMTSVNEEAMWLPGGTRVTFALQTDDFGRPQAFDVKRLEEPGAKGLDRVEGQAPVADLRNPMDGSSQQLPEASAAAVPPAALPAPPQGRAGTAEAPQAPPRVAVPPLPPLPPRPRRVAPPHPQHSSLDPDAAAARGRSRSRSPGRGRRARSASADRSPSSPPRSRSEASGSKGGSRAVSPGSESSATGQQGTEHGAPGEEGSAAPAAAADSAYLEVVGNLPDLRNEGTPPEARLAAMFNPTLRILPDFDKAAGQEPVQAAWSRSAGSVIMRLQNATLAGSAARILDGLDVFGTKLRVRTIGEDEAQMVLSAVKG